MRDETPFNIQESKKLYAIAFSLSLLIHGILVLLVIIIPKFEFPSKFSEFKSYKIKLVSSEQLGKVSSSSKSALRDISKPLVGKTSSTSKSLPVYPVKKIAVESEGITSSKTEIKKLEPPNIDEKPRQTKEISQAWESLIPSLSPKATPKPITQRQELLSEPEPGQSTGKTGIQSTGKEKGQSAKGESSSQKTSKGEDSGTESGQSTEEYGLARRLYYSEVWRAIQNQWALPVDLLNREDLEAILIIKVRRDGTIMDVRFEKKSGNELFDTSCWKAIQKANPLPPFPKTYSPPYEEIGIRFRPKDLKRS